MRLTQCWTLAFAFLMLLTTTLTASISSAAAAGNAPADNSAAATKMTVADVGKVAGLTGVKLLPKDPNKIDDLSFADQSGKVLLRVYLTSGKALFATEKDGAKNNELYKSIAGIGDDAFSFGSKSFGTLMLSVLKGDHVGRLTTQVDGKTMKAALNDQQLQDLAKILASRL
jgi:hypothetical protein